MNKMVTEVNFDFKELLKIAGNHQANVENRFKRKETAIKRQ